MSVPVEPSPLESLPAAQARALVGVFCDIDDTLTWEGQLVPEAFAALHALRAAGLRVVPITGRPGGWVDHIARMWPVDAVVGENGAFWMRHDAATRKLRTVFAGALQPLQRRVSSRSKSARGGEGVVDVGQDASNPLF